MKFNITKGSLVAWIIVFGVAGTEGLLRHLGLNDLADLVHSILGSIDLSKLSWPALLALVASILKLHNSEKLLK